MLLNLLQHYQLLWQYPRRFPWSFGVPKTDCGEGGAGFLDLQLMIAQLRDMLAAEDSSIVAQEDEHCVSFFPQGPEADCLAI